MDRSIRAFVVGSVLMGAGVWASAQGAAPRVLVLDQQARTVTALELPGGRAAATASVQGTPSQLSRTADGQRLLVLDRGEGRDAGDNGFQAKTRAAVTILDGRTLAVRGRVELGWVSIRRRCCRPTATGCRCWGPASRDVRRPKA